MKAPRIAYWASTPVDNWRIEVPIDPSEVYETTNESHFSHMGKPFQAQRFIIQCRWDRIEFDVRGPNIKKDKTLGTLDFSASLKKEEAKAQLPKTYFVAVREAEKLMAGIDASALQAKNQILKGVIR